VTPRRIEIRDGKVATNVDARLAGLGALRNPLLPKDNLA